MLAKKFAIGFGIAVLLPIMVYYGVSTFSPKVKWEDYQIEDYHLKYKDASGEEKEALIRERKELTKKRKKHLKRFESHLFAVSVPIGLAAIIFGSITSVQAVGAGLIFGGISTLSSGYFSYWSELSDVARFLSLLGAFIVLVVIGYNKLNTSEKGQKG